MCLFIICQGVKVCLRQKCEMCVQCECVQCVSVSVVRSVGGETVCGLNRSNRKREKQHRSLAATGLIEKEKNNTAHSRPRKAAIVHPDAAELVALAAAASKAAALRAVGLLRGVLPLVGLRDDRGGVRFSGERA